MSNRPVSRNSSSASSSKLLKFAEYGSLAASVVGAIASAASQQIVYAAAPLTVSLALNLVNRQRFEQQTQHRITTAIAQVDESLVQLDRRIAEIQSQLTTELNQQISRLEAASAAQNSETERAFAEFAARLAELSQQFAQEVQAIRLQLEAQPEPVSPATVRLIEQSLTQLIERLSELEATSRPAVDPGALDGIRRSIQQLFERVSGLEAQLEQSAQPASEPQDRPPQTPPVGNDQDLEELQLNLGIDFGTSFTKVCFRDIARDRSEVVTFADRATRVEEALLPTQIGILTDGTLAAGLTAAEWQDLEPQVKTRIEFIKMRLAGLDLPQTDTWRLEQLPELDQPNRVEDLCAYYLSRVINRAQNWIRQNKAELIVNHRIVWSANVGVPVAYCDSPALARFEKVLSLAWLLSNEPQTEQFTLESLTKQMAELRSRLDLDQPLDCFAVPEIAAEAWSFLNSREADDGFYIFFDVGDGTIDGTAFYYCREEGEPKVDFYAARVEPLGVTALSQLLSNELNNSVPYLKRRLCRRFPHEPDFVSSQARKQIQQLVADVVWQGKEGHFKRFPNGRRPGTAKSDFQHHLAIFVGGGGGTTAFYPQTITATHSDFNHGRAGIPPYTVKALPLPKDLVLSKFVKKDFHRFAVAYGLSLPIYEGAIVRLPSQVATDQPSRRPRYPDPRPRHTDMKDCC